MAVAEVAVVNRTRSTQVAARALVADSFWRRAKGLLGQAGLPPGGGLLIRPCRHIHMLGMRFAIDALYVAAGGEVVACVPDLRPGRIGPYVRRAAWVLELPVGTIAASGTACGDVLDVALLSRD